MSKKARSEGNRVACLIKANKAEFYIADVDLEDDSLDVLACSEAVVKTLGKTKAAFMIISAGITTLTTVVHVPLELEDKIDAQEWLSVSTAGLNNTIKGNMAIVVKQELGSETLKEDTAFKLKDVVRANGFKYLSDKGCMGDDESDEFIGLDDL